MSLPLPPARLLNRSVVAWALYDWANSAFATTVMAAFFPYFFKDYWNSAVPVGESTFRLATANSVASLIVVAMAPVLGAIADRGGVRKRFLVFFAYLGALSTAGLGIAAQGQWGLAALLYVLGIIGFSGSNIFYDSLLITTAPVTRLDAVSALGYALGYLGGGLLFAVNVLMVMYPDFFGLSGPEQAIQVSFLTVAVWWGAFSIPLLRYVKEPTQPVRDSGLAAVRGGILQLFRTFREIRRLKILFMFLVGYWLYIDGVDTVIRMAMDYGLALGFQIEYLMIALLLVQFIGFPAALAFGRVGEKFGAKKGILACIGVYSIITVWAVVMDSPVEFFGLAIGVGLVQGGVQSLSRSLYARLVPRSRTAEFFGFYNMLGKFAAVIGPLMMGTIALWTNQPRLSILSLIILFIGGAVLLYLVDEEEGIRAAARFEEEGLASAATKPENS